MRPLFLFPIGLFRSFLLSSSTGVHFSLLYSSKVFYPLTFSYHSVFNMVIGSQFENKNLEVFQVLTRENRYDVSVKQG